MVPVLAGPCNDVTGDMIRKSDNKAKEERKSMTRTALEQTISERVKNSSPECEAFVGVIIEHVKPKQPGDANWGLRGVRYGKANREACAEALSKLVAEGQLEFELSDSHA